jgi:hypothetical protein
MAHGVIYFFPGGTQSQYDKTVVEVHPAGGGLPEGQTFHAAGASDGGWTIGAVHNSKAGWEKFRDGTLVPRMQQGIAGGFETPPQETGFEIHNLLP